MLFACLLFINKYSGDNLSKYKAFNIRRYSVEINNSKFEACGAADWAIIYLNNDNKNVSLTSSIYCNVFVTSFIIHIV